MFLKRETKSGWKGGSAGLQPGGLREEKNGGFKPRFQAPVLKPTGSKRNVFTGLKPGASTVAEAICGMTCFRRSILFAWTLLAILCLALSVLATAGETGSNASVVSGTVADPSGAVVPGATVEIHNPVSKFQRSATTDGAGQFSFTNVPLNTYHLSVSATGFTAYVQDLDVRSAVPLSLKITLQITASAENVT